MYSWERERLLDSLAGNDYLVYVLSLQKSNSALAVRYCYLYKLYLAASIPSYQCAYNQLSINIKAMKWQAFGESTPVLCLEAAPTRYGSQHEGIGVGFYKRGFDQVVRESRRRWEAAYISGTAGTMRPGTKHGVGIP